jgi:hypothetical protein
MPPHPAGEIELIDPGLDDDGGMDAVAHQTHGKGCSTVDTSNACCGTYDTGSVCCYTCRTTV